MVSGDFRTDTGAKILHTDPTQSSFARRVIQMDSYSEKIWIVSRIKIEMGWSLNNKPLSALGLPPSRRVDILTQTESRCSTVGGFNYRTIIKSLSPICTRSIPTKGLGTLSVCLFSESALCRRRRIIITLKLSMLDRGLGNLYLHVFSRQSLTSSSAKFR